MTDVERALAEADAVTDQPQHWLVANGYDHIVALAKAYRTASARIAALEAELTDARAEARILHPTTMREAQQLQGYVNSIVAPIVLGDPMQSVSITAEGYAEVHDHRRRAGLAGAAGEGVQGSVGEV